MEMSGCSCPNCGHIGKQDTFQNHKPDGAITWRCPKCKHIAPDFITLTEDSGLEKLSKIEKSVKDGTYVAGSVRDWIIEHKFNYNPEPPRRIRPRAIPVAEVPEPWDVPGDPPELADPPRYVFRNGGVRREERPHGHRHHDGEHLWDGHGQRWLVRARWFQIEQRRLDRRRELQQQNPLDIPMPLPEGEGEQALDAEQERPMPEVRVEDDNYDHEEDE